MILKQMIKNQILDYSHEHNIHLSQEELRIATNGVEYYISEVMADSVKDSVSSVLYDREHKLEKEFCKQYMDEIATVENLTIEDCKYSWNINKTRIKNLDDVDEIIEELKLN
jgi:hypothetical protein